MKIFKLIILFIVVACTGSFSSLKPEEVAIKYQKSRYLDYESSYKYLWPNSVKKEEFMKFNVAYIKFEQLKHKFKFEIVKTEGTGDERTVTINVSRPDIETISKNIFQVKIGQDKKVIEQIIFEEMKKETSPTKTIATKVYLKQGPDKTWFVLPKN